MARFSATHPWWVIISSLLITVFFGFMIETRLKIEPNWIDLVPRYDKSVQEFTTITSNFGSATPIILAIENDDKQKLKAIALEVAHDLERMTNFFRRVEVSVDKDFFYNHAFMLEKTSQLKQAKDTMNNFDLLPYLRNMNDSFEKTYIGGESDLGDDELQVVRGINSLVDLLGSMNHSFEQDDPGQWGRSQADQGVEDMLYQFSADQKMVLITILPLSPVSDLDVIMEFVPELNKEIDTIKAKYPGTRMRMTGMHIVSHDEMASMEGDTMVLTLIAFIIILLTFVVVFKMWGAPLLAMLSLMLGIIWDLGITALTIGRLNLMTSMTAVILIGLGVDYFVHIISGYTEGKKEGLSTPEACVYSMDKVGTGVFIGGLTTAIAFFILGFSKMQMFKELGIVLGTGIVATMLVSFLLLPAFLSAFLKDKKKERPQWLKIVLTILAVITIIPGILILTQKIAEKISHHRQGDASEVFSRWGKTTTRKPVFILITIAVVSVVFGVTMFFNKMDSNLMNIEDQSLDSIVLQREVVKRYGLSDTALIYTTSNIQQSQAIAEQLEDNKLVRMVNSLASYIPSGKNQQQRLPYLRQIQAGLRAYTPSTRIDPTALSNEIDRLDMNLRELSQMATLGGQKLLEQRLESLLSNGSSYSQSRDALIRKLASENTDSLGRFQQAYGQVMKKTYLGMATPQLITRQDLPASVLDTYINKQGTRYLNYVYSKTDLWENTADSPFILGVREIAPQATGMPVLVQVLLREGGREGRKAIGWSLLAIVILLLIDFKNVKHTLIAIIPLVLGFIWMLGILPLTTRPMDIMMMMIIPLIIGIGIDDGVHILHRYRKEGDNMPRILGTTGNALFLTTFTTMIGFGSLMFAKMEGLRSMGIILFIGIGACYIITVSVLPTLLHLMDKKKNGGH